MSLGLVERGFAAVAPKFGDDVRLIGGFVGGPVLPALPAGWVDVRLVVALPVERFAGLRPWRDSITMTVPADNGVTLQVNARDVLTWARMMLRGHGGTINTIMQGHPDGDLALLNTMQSIALRCANEDTASYFEALGEPVPSWYLWPGGTLTGNYRMEIVESWLSECRR